MGKTPMVVNDCPGFFVNRVLFPYFGGFHMLLRDGADFLAVDKVMEKFGWPMGPAYLMDVVGIDTGRARRGRDGRGLPGAHEATTSRTPRPVLFETTSASGQKTGDGFYNYEPDKKGKPKQDRRTR